MKTSNFTPREIVSELDRFIIGQGKAKKAVAIALRNRWRRQLVEKPLRDEIMPKNIIMIGPTGVGKTEIARRLAKLAKAPFIKVEASKFTEVGYIGKDVESMIRELTDIAVNQVREEEAKRVRVRAQELAEERLLDLLLPKESREEELEFPSAEEIGAEEESAKIVEATPKPPAKKKVSTREKLRKLLREGKLDDRSVEIFSEPKMQMPSIEVVAAGSIEEMGSNLRDMFSNIMGQGGKKKRKIKVPEALEMITDEEAARLIDMEVVLKEAKERVEQNGIVFLDEIDKIASPGGEGARQGPDVSRAGVQRDILPIIEGSSVMTKHGIVHTDHILFIAAGAFHMTKPSDLIPELQGRFPIRVELDSLSREDFFKILTETENSLTKQYSALMNTEGIEVNFGKDAIMEVCDVASQVNQEMEDIGARRLHTVMEKLLENLSFDAPEKKITKVTIDKKYVEKELADIVKDHDLRRYIL